MSVPIRVLILEDQLADAELMLHELGRAGFDPDWRRVESEPDYLARLDATLDLILADYHLSQYDAMRALRSLQERGLDIPFIVVTGSISEEVAAECMKQGAADYLLKDRLTRLGPAVIQALEQRRLREGKRRADALVQLQSTVLEAAANAILITDRDGRIAWVNPAFTRLTGYTFQETWGQNPRILKSGEHDQAFYRSLWETILAGQVWSGEIVNRRKDGSVYTEEMTVTPLRDERGAVSHFIGIKQDITDRKKGEEALQRYVKHLENLRRIDRGILGAESAEEIAQTALRHIRQLVPCRCASVALFDFATRTLTLLAGEAGDETLLGTGPRLSLEAFGISEALRQGQVDVVEDITKEPGRCPVDAALRAGGMRSCVRAPLVVQGHVIGSLNLGMDSADRPTPEDLEIARDVADQLAVAIQQARSHATAVRRGEELAALLRAARSLMAGLDLQATIERIAEETSHIAETPHIGILLLDEEARVLRPAVFWNAPPEFQIPLGVGFSGIVAATGQPLFVADTQSDPRLLLPERERELGIRTYLGLPIKTRDKVLGVLIINTTAPRHYTPDELAYLSSFADQVAIAIEHAQLYEAIRHHAAQLEALLRATRSVMSGLDLQGILERIVEEAAAISGCQHVKLLLVDKPGEVLRTMAVKGTAMSRGDELPLGTGLSGLVAATGQPLFVPDCPRDARNLVADKDREMGLVTYLGLPITVQEEVVGVLTFNTTAPREYGPGELAYLASYADQAANAIENARLYEVVRRHAAELEDRVQERTHELEAANQQLQDASRHKSEFLANMSHEIRTPLNSIIGFSDLLQDQHVGPLNEKQARYITHISNGGKHLLQLIGDILDLSKVEAGKFILQPEPLPVAQTLEDILVVARGLANKKAQTIEAQIEPDLPVLRADPVRFKQILFNLLSNAVKFTPDKGTITLTARRVDWSNSQLVDSARRLDQLTTRPIDIPGEWLEIRVTDTGIGIKPEDLPRLFRDFVQLETTKAQEHEGTGLGLALTKRLVELHGGRIWAESEGEGKGSTFTVLLPFAGSGEDREH